MLQPPRVVPGTWFRWRVAACLTLFAAVGLLHGQDTELPDVITTIRELRNLTPEQARQQIPVRVTGTVTYFEPFRSLAFIQDETGGAYFSPHLIWNPDETPEGEDPPPMPRAGDRYQIFGASSDGNFAPIISGPKHGESIYFGRYGFPDPAPLDPDRFVDPELEARWIEATGVVRALRRFDQRLTLDVTDGVNSFTVSIPGDWEERSLPRELRGARIRVQGVFGSLVDQSSRRLVGVRIYTPFRYFIRELDSGYDVAFDSETVEVSELMQYRPKDAGLVHLRGVVTSRGPDGEIFLRAGEERAPLTVKPLFPASPENDVRRGEQIDVAGFPILLGVSPALDAAEIRRVDEPSLAPQPIPLPNDDIDEEWAAEFVTVEGRLVDRFASNNQQFLLLSDGPRTFPAVVRYPEGQAPMEIPLDSWLRVEGICIVSQDAIDQPLEPWLSPRAGAVEGFKLWVSSPAAVQVLREPPFWTVPRLLAALTAFGALLFATVIWTGIMQRKIRQQTQIIEERIEQERVAEERDRIARELHDSIEQELAALGIQLDLARSCPPGNEQDRLDALSTAQRLLRRTQYETRRSIQDLRDRLLDRATLADALQILAQRLMSEFKTEFKVSLAKPNFTVPGPVAHNLLRIAQEALNNAIRHSKGQGVELSLELLDAGALKLSISDEGPGFDPQKPHPGHFGLEGMRERARRIKGKLDIQSTPGNGSTITVTWSQSAKPKSS